MTILSGRCCNTELWLFRTRPSVSKCGRYTPAYTHQSYSSPASQSDRVVGDQQPAYLSHPSAWSKQSLRLRTEQRATIRRLESLLDFLGLVMCTCITPVRLESGEFSCMPSTRLARTCRHLWSHRYLSMLLPTRRARLSCNQRQQRQCHTQRDAKHDSNRAYAKRHETRRAT